MKSNYGVTKIVFHPHSRGEYDADSQIGIWGLNRSGGLGTRHADTTRAKNPVDGE